MIGTLLITILVLYFTLNWWKQKPKNFPPGPPCLPVIGCVLSMPSKHIHFTIVNEWRKKYGPVVGLVFGPIKSVIFCGGHEVIEVLKKEEFQGRIKSEVIRERSFNKHLGIIFSDGPFWVEQRRFSIRHLKDFGFGKRSMEGLIMEEVEDLMEDMSKKGTFQVQGIFAASTLNVLWGMIAGKRYSRDDKQLQELLHIVEQFFRTSNPSGGILLAFPFLRNIFPNIAGYKTNLDGIRDMQNFFRKTIKEHEKTIDENNPRDYIDVYLKEMKQQKNNVDSTFTEEGLIMNCLDFFGAGAETTTGTLAFSLLYMILYPEVQKAVQKELDSVIGQDRRPTLDDRPSLHYTEAVISELFRFTTVAPLTAPHRTVKDTYFNNYFIPKDTMIMICLDSLFQDEEHWGDPEVFRPERFLNPEGIFVRDEWIVPFGIGKRMCLGEALARNSSFLFFTTLLQQFTFSIPEGDPKPSTYPLPGITIAPQPFRVTVTKRF